MNQTKEQVFLRGTLQRFIQSRQVQCRGINQQMNRQQAINRYVDLIRREEKRRKSHKLPHTTPKHPLLPLARLLESAIFRESVQKKIKAKVKERQDPPPDPPTLKTLFIDPSIKTEMRSTKRKFHLYQEEMERKVTEERHSHERHQPKQLRHTKRIQIEPEQFAVLSQTHSLLLARPPQHHPRLTEHRHPRKEDNRGISELNGSIFHFQHGSPTKPFFEGMFHNKEKPEQAEVYQLLKTMSPLTVKSKMLAEELADSKNTELRAQMLRRVANQGLPNKRKVGKIKQLHRRQRSSLINLRPKNEEITAWQLTEG